MTLKGVLSAASATLTGALSAASATFTGVVTASDIVLAGADCAEGFDVDDGTLTPGSVVVFTDTGGLAAAAEPYDTRVAGVIYGAGAYRPGVILDRRPAAGARAPVALVGKVVCKVDARFAPIRLGDLLTTSPMPGHAMRATDSDRAFGAVIGNALASRPDGVGLIPMLLRHETQFTCRNPLQPATLPALAPGNSSRTRALTEPGRDHRAGWRSLDQTKTFAARDETPQNVTVAPPTKCN